MFSLIIVTKSSEKDIVLKECIICLKKHFYTEWLILFKVFLLYNGKFDYIETLPMEHLLLQECCLNDTLLEVGCIEGACSLKNLAR